VPGPEAFRADIFAPSKAGTRMRPPPERFRAKSLITVQQIVRDFGRLAGLWPPGYTDDPCPAIRRAAESASAADPTDRERQLIADAVLVRQRFCM